MKSGLIKVLQNDPMALVIRTSAFFGPWDSANFVTTALNSLKSGIQFAAANDVFISPTYVPDLVNMSLDLLLDDESGIWHLANRGVLSWSMLAQEVASRARFDSSLISAVGVLELGLKALRPKYSALKSNNGLLMPSLDNALDRYFHEQECLVL